MTDADMEQLSRLLREAEALGSRAWMDARARDQRQRLALVSCLLDDAFQGVEDGVPIYDPMGVNRAHEVVGAPELGVVLRSDS